MVNSEVIKVAASNTEEQITQALSSVAKGNIITTVNVQNLPESEISYVKVAGYLVAVPQALTRYVLQDKHLFMFISGRKPRRTEDDWGSNKTPISVRYPNIGIRTLQLPKYAEWAESAIKVQELTHQFMKSNKNASVSKLPEVRKA